MSTIALPMWKAMMAFNDLCRLKYWQRLWIVQEILLAPKLTLLYGTPRCPWDAFSAIVQSQYDSGTYGHQRSPKDHPRSISADFSDVDSFASID